MARPSLIVVVSVGCAALASVARADAARDKCVAQLKTGERPCVLVIEKDAAAPLPDAGATACFGLTAAGSKAEAKAIFDQKVPAGFAWGTLPTKGDRDCRGFWTLPADKVQAAPPPVALSNPVGVAASAEAQAAELLQNANLKALLDTYVAAGSRFEVVGEAKSDAVEELVQVLGQIVLERGSQAAMALGQARLLDALQCDVSNEERAAEAPELPHTCALVRALTVEDLAAAGKLLKQALVADLYELAKKRSGLAALGAPDLEALITLALDRVVFASLARKGEIDAKAIDLIVSELITLARSSLVDADKQREPFVALSIAAAALAACELHLQSDPAAVLSRCDIEQNVRTLVETIGAPATTRRLALTLAGQLLVARSATVHDDAARLSAVVDAIFEVGCATADGGCVVPDKIPPKASTLTPGQYLALLRPLAHAAIERDGTALIQAGLAFVASSAQPSSQRSARMLVRIVQVSEAYTSARDVEATDDEPVSTAFEQRKQLIEGLADDFADRTGRGGDTIVSLGGSLRLLAGYRAVQEGEDDALMGPLGLTLGMSVAHLAENDGCAGFFMELAFVDLGQYVAFEDGTELKKPELDAVLSPWLTLGAAWGRQNPFFIAASVGYSPTHRVSEGERVAGSFNAGVTAGVNVPLLDLN